MPWSNQGGGGGWQGGRGPWSQGPWGQGPSGPPGRGGNQPPDLEELIRKSQERLRQILPGGGGSTGSFGRGQWLAVIVLVLLGWLYMSANTIKPDENGLVLRLGSYNRTVGPGLHFVFWPVERIEKLPVEAENQIDFGGAGKGEGLMLAGDQNIVDMRFTVLWKIKDPRDFLFNVAEQEELVTRVAESAMREVVGRTPAEEIRTRGRQAAQDQVRDLIQRTLDGYRSGVLITGVQLEKADPPPQVVDAFEEVQRAEQNQNKLIREAEQYRNQILGQARGDAARLVADAKAYKSRVVAEAQGEAQRFLSVYAEYDKAKDVTRQRLFLETLEDVLQKSNKVIIEEGKEGTGVVPYLPLPELQKRQNAPARTATTGAQQ
ncbi:MAG TPA: FtsH protease activity modulator HflK [Aestuariivirgaceae bacterium]|jgi:modulator of FtsH protease HflK|nr:FtsH protease activity modulator HflK [Aestuariivirgaceae bacterium]